MPILLVCFSACFIIIVLVQLRGSTQGHQIASPIPHWRNNRGVPVPPWEKNSILDHTDVVTLPLQQVASSCGVINAVLSLVLIFLLVILILGMFLKDFVSFKDLLEYVFG